MKVSIMIRGINRIKVALVENKRINKWLAVQLSKNPGTISKRCTSILQPNLETLEKITECLGVDEKDLL